VLSMQTETRQLRCADIFSQQRVLVVGLGDTGLSCVRFLHPRGVELAVTDSRESPPGLKVLQEEFPDVAVFVGGFDQQAISRADVLLLSPGVSLATPLIAGAVAKGKPVLGDIEVFARCVDKPVVAITGSNGKSTVTALLGEMARVARTQACVGGNIGTPALQLVDQNDETQLYVLELSSFQLETTSSLDATASVILNLSEDHMDRYASLDEYARAKARIYRGRGIAVINRDDPLVVSLAPTRDADRKILSFTLGEPTDEDCFGVIGKNAQAQLARGSRLLLPVSEIRIKGWHNVANALAALALGSAVGLPMPAMLEALRGFPGLSHRTQWVAEHNGVQWYNDSKATNVGAAIAAIAGLQAGTLFVILGGQGKGQDFSPLRDVLESRDCHALLLGEDAERIAAALGEGVTCTRVTDMADAVNTALRLAQSGDVVLLSPACASFDMFSGYAHRGEVFMQLVREAIQ